MKQLSFITIALATLAFTACSSDDGLDGSNAGGRQSLQLVSNLSSKSTNINLQKTQIAEGVKIGVFVQNSKGFISGGNNAVQTASGTGTFTGSPIYFPEDGSAVSVKAYAPYSSSFGDMLDENADFSVATNQSTDEGYLASDLLHGVPSGTNSFTEENPLVVLNFTHKLSKLTIKFKTSNETDVDLKGSTINIVNTLPSTTLKVADGTLGAAMGTATTIKAATYTTDATEFVASAILVPQTVAQGNFIQVVLTNGKMLNAKLNTEATFASGKAYTYVVNISGQGSDVFAEIELNSTVTDWDDATTPLTGDVSEEELPEVTFSPTSFTALSSGQNATYENGVYTWTASTNNLMTIIDFASEGISLADFKTLEVTTSDMTESASWRMGYVLDGGSFTQFTGSPYYSAGKKTIDLAALAASGVDLSKVTKIQMGGNSGSGGSITITPANVVLKGNGGGSSEGGSSDGNTLTATFGTPGGNASYDTATSTYSWTASSNNLMNCFTFSNGELANYTTLTFKFSDNGGEPVRINILYSDNTNNNTNSGYYSAGEKTITLSEVLSDGKSLTDVTAIRFGGYNGTGSCIIKASDIYLK